MAKVDGISPDLARFLDSLAPDDRESLLEILRDPQTFLAEDMEDVLVILSNLRN